VNREPQLESLLRTLKLPGMADMLGERLAQAAASQLGHAELLGLLCGDEIARRDAAGLARRLAAARFESTCAIEDFDFGYNPDIPAGIIRDLAGLAFLAAGQSVILHGPVGVGKTMLAQALGQLACRRGPHRRVHQNQPAARRPRRRSGRPNVGHPAAALGPTRAADLRRLRDAGTEHGPGRRPL
jgi:DNA replication protein DnaC